MYMRESNSGLFYSDKSILLQYIFSTYILLKIVQLLLNTKSKVTQLE